MAFITPFCGIRYNSEKISDLASVTAPPNNRISEEFYNQLRAKSEYNIIKTGFCEQENSLSENNPIENTELISEWLEKGILKKDLKPAIYIYEQRFKMKNNLQSLKGIICLVKLEDYDKKVILPHQKTSQSSCKHQDNLIKNVKANISPIFSLYNDSDISISSIIVANSSTTPDISFVNDDGITQNLWVIDDPEVISQLTERFNDKQIFIADGHHRYEAALKYKNEMNSQNPDTKDAPYDYVMMSLMPMYSSGLFVLPTHRLLKGIESFDENILINMLTEDFKVSRIFFTSNDYEKIIIDRISDVINEKYFGLYTGKDYYYLLKPYKQNTDNPEDTDSDDILGNLGATLLNSSILKKYFRLSEEELENPQFMTYTRSAKEAIHQVQIDNYQCAFFLNSTRVDELRRVAESGKMMPLKSTFFWPKTITGLVIYKF